MESLDKKLLYYYRLCSVIRKLKVIDCCVCLSLGVRLIEEHSRQKQEETFQRKKPKCSHHHFRGNTFA